MDLNYTDNYSIPLGEQDGPWLYDLTWDDATWILTASFIIFTMQTGFGMLESGCVSIKNEANIMMKNVVDVVFGGFTYWIFGFGLSFGTAKGSSSIFGFGEFMVDADFRIMGPVFAAFMFQLSFATTATTIVSGAMAERCNFRSYCVFSLTNTVVYCIPARWIWGPKGFLAEMGAIDIAGSGAVHLLGGVSGCVAAWMLGPRLGRYDNGPDSLPLGNPTSCIVGLFILWWGWLAFNSGSTFGVSGEKWKFAARAAVTTTIASIGGGLVGCIYAFIKPGKFIEVMDLVNPILGALVGITAGCAVYHTYDALVVGIVGGLIILGVSKIPDRLGIDDPVGATVVHGFGGIWGMLAVGLFTEDDRGLGITKGKSGLFRGGGVRLLQLQLFACVCIMIWSATSTFSILWLINKFVPIRMEAHEELLGADFVEHLVRRRHAGITPALSALVHRHHDLLEVEKNAVTVGGANFVHDQIVHTISDVKLKPWNRAKAKAWAAAIFATSLRRRRRGCVAPVPLGQWLCPQRLGVMTVESVVENSLGKPLSLEYYGSSGGNNFNYNSKIEYFNNYVNDYTTRFSVTGEDDIIFGKLPAIYS